MSSSVSQLVSLYNPGFIQSAMGGVWARRYRENKRTVWVVLTVLGICGLILLFSMRRLERYARMRTSDDMRRHVAQDISSSPWGIGLLFSQTTAGGLVLCLASERIYLRKKINFAVP